MSDRRPGMTRPDAEFAPSGSLDDFVSWMSGGTPPKDIRKYWSGDVPWLTPKDMKSFDVHATTDYLTQTGVAIGSRMAPVDATYIVVRGMILAHTFPVCQMATPAAFNQDVKAVVPGDRLLPRYLAYWFAGHADAFLRVVGESTHGTKKIDLSDLRKFPIRVPATLEQMRIVEILETLDDQIRATEQIIGKLIWAQEGLVVDLLTSGIDENGALRNAARSPEQFYDSPIGRVPVGWDIAPLSAYRHPLRPYLKTGPFGSSLKQEHWVNEGVPVVTIGSLGNGVFIDTELLHISEATAGALASYALCPGDIVFSRVADVGRSAVIREREKNWIMSSNMMWISVDPSRADSRFVRANIATNPNLRGQIRRYVNSAGRDVANAKIMNLLQFPWPPLKEQSAIADRIAVSDERIATEQSRTAKLYAYKDGLMTDLLTGRVRVPAEAAL
jgi:type I restriction enzyme S subunit